MGEVRLREAEVSGQNQHGSGVARRLGTLVPAVIVGVCTIASTGCINDVITASRSSSTLVIERIGAARGGTSDTPVNTFLQSDVFTCTDEDPPECGIFEDTARVTTRLGFKDPGTAENPSSPTSANFITIKRYQIEYERSDGRSKPGVDVPYPWEGAMTFTTVSGIQTAEFTLVRAAAKLEPPLLALRGGGGAVAINTIAVITFFGHDGTGAEVIADGTIGITFADWAP